MKYVIITGSSGLVGSESSIFFHNKKFKILGIDNNKRYLFISIISNIIKINVTHKQ